MFHVIINKTHNLFGTIFLRSMISFSMKVVIFESRMAIRLKNMKKKVVLQKRYKSFLFLVSQDVANILKFCPTNVTGHTYLKFLFCFDFRYCTTCYSLVHLIFPLDQVNKIVIY